MQSEGKRKSNDDGMNRAFGTETDGDVEGRVDEDLGVGADGVSGVGVHRDLGGGVQGNLGVGFDGNLGVRVDVEFGDGMVGSCGGRVNKKQKKSKIDLSLILDGEREHSKAPYVDSDSDEDKENECKNNKNRIKVNVLNSSVGYKDIDRDSNDIYIGEDVTLKSMGKPCSGVFAAKNFKPGDCIFLDEYRSGIYMWVTLSPMTTRENISSRQKSKIVELAVLDSEVSSSLNFDCVNNEYPRGYLWYISFIDKNKHLYLLTFSRFHRINNFSVSLDRFNSTIDVNVSDPFKFDDIFGVKAVRHIKKNEQILLHTYILGKKIYKIDCFEVR